MPPDPPTDHYSGAFAALEAEAKNRTGKELSACTSGGLARVWAAAKDNPGLKFAAEVELEKVRQRRLLEAAQERTET